jgi:hypothetical protein
MYRTVILPVVLYGCETWALSLREELRLIVFDNRVLRKIFGPKADGIMGEWRNCITRSCIHHQMFSVIKSRMRWAGHVARRGEERCMQGFGVDTLWKEAAWNIYA